MNPLRLAAALLMLTQGVAAMSQPRIPLREHPDAIMAPSAEVAAMRAWALAAFAGQAPSGAVALRVLRQDHSVLRHGQSVIETPLRIGARSFARGLGTHAISRIAVELPAGAVRFLASVGVDNNHDTAGARGSVTFAALAGEAVLAKTGVLRGGMEPVPFEAAIPAGVREIILEVGSGGDGEGFDQADWADARLLLADGRELRLDSTAPDLLPSAAGPPFSFRLDGRPSAELLPAWRRDVEARPTPEGELLTVTWTDPASGLEVAAVVRLYTAKGAAYPIADWTLHITNGGGGDSPLIEDLRAVDLPLRTGYARVPVTLHGLSGDSCSGESFVPFARTVEPDQPIHMAPTGGRSSNTTAFPFFEARYAEYGLTAAVGWTGQWAADISRQPNGPARLAAGMERTRLRLHAGETIRTPRIVLMAWRGDPQVAQNRWRRFMIHRVAPRIAGAPPVLPVDLQTFDRYYTRPGWATEEGQLKAVEAGKRLGFTDYWFDAAWFPNGFPTGVGTWEPDPVRFPRGLKPISDAAHAAGMRTVVWFEPERVAEGSRIANEHPELVHGGAKGGLFRLDDPAARRWLTELLVRRISEFELDFYRNDFNMEPLPYWRAADQPEREGITEIRYVEGLYAMWDELRARRPGLLIDNCASGGRRIDIEMLSRSVPLWHSDTGCFAGHEEWDQGLAPALSRYVPIHSTGVWANTDYAMRGAATMGINFNQPYLEPELQPELVRTRVAEVLASAPYWYGDLWVITPPDTDPARFAAWQLHRPDLDAGIVLAFRRPQCEMAGIIVALRSVRAGALYEVTTVDEAGHAVTARRRGSTLLDLALRIPHRAASLLIRYRRIGRQ